MPALTNHVFEIVSMTGTEYRGSIGTCFVPIPHKSICTVHTCTVLYIHVLYLYIHVLYIHVLYIHVLYIHTSQHTDSKNQMKLPVHNSRKKKLISYTPCLLQVFPAAFSTAADQTRMQIFKSSDALMIRKD